MLSLRQLKPAGKARISVEIFGFGLACADEIADPFDFAVVAPAPSVTRCLCCDNLPVRVAFLVRGVAPIAKGDGTLEVGSAVNLLSLAGPDSRVISGLMVGLKPLGT